MRVVILGLGQYPKGSGIAAALFFARRKDDVTVIEPYPTPAMEKNFQRLERLTNVTIFKGLVPEERVKQADLMVKHQRLRMTEPAVLLGRQAGVQFASDVSIFLESCPAKIIAVTGTRGKSTTSAIIAHVLRTARISRAVWLGGNNLVSPLTFLSRVKKNDLVVLELSSWQLEELGRLGISPPIAIWTNLMPDHLNTYASMQEYAEAKAQIFLHQKKDDLVFFPVGQAFDMWAKRAPGRAVRFGPRSAAARLVRSSRFALIGAHNFMNALIAVTVVRFLGVDARSIRQGLATFQGLPSRLQCIAVKKGVIYIDDSTSTTPEATSAALLALKGKNIRLIFGGSDKELVFDDLARVLKHRQPDIFLLPGTAHDKIVSAFARNDIAYTDAASMQQAVRLASHAAKRGDCVLLSPGCTSFGLFKNEFDRAKAFIREVKKI